MIKFTKKNIFVILIIIVAIVRVLLTSKLTVFQIGNSSVDDVWGIFTAWNLKKGWWQGKIYTSNSMIKGMTSSLLLAFSSSIGLSYINLVTILYIGSVILFIYSIRNVVKNKYILFISYLIMLFNPVMFGKELVQRCYRNAFVPALSLYIINMYIIMLLHKQEDKNYKMICYNVIAGILLGLFWNLREDSIWIIPFIVFISVFIFIKEYKNKKKIFFNIVILLIPVIITIVINNVICLINYKYYGVYQRIDFASNTIFVKTINYIQKIDYSNIDDMHNVTKEKLNMLFEVSPTLKKCSNKIIEYFDEYEKQDVNPADGKMQNGWFGWCMRSALSHYNTGAYKDYNTSNEYYSKIYKELIEATNKGEIKLKKGFYNKTAIVNNFIKSILNSSRFVINFETIETDINVNSIYTMNIVTEWYEEITLNKMIYSEEDIEKYQVADLTEQNEYLEKYGGLEIILNGITKIYQCCNFILFIISIISYFVITYMLIMKKDVLLKDTWIIMSGLIGSIFTIICGVSWVNVTACDAINYSYLSGTYALLIAFELIGIYYVIINIKKLKKEKKNGRI